MDAKNPFDAAVARRIESVKLLSEVDTQQKTNMPTEQNISLILAELRELRQKVEGASISASCSGTDITVTLNWG